MRAASYEYALSPWHRFRRAHKHPDSPPAEANRRALLGALLELPPPYRRTVLLYDGLGLDLPETAAETEAIPPPPPTGCCTPGRSSGSGSPSSPSRRPCTGASRLVAGDSGGGPPGGPHIRAGSEKRSRTWTRAVLGVTAVLIGVTGFTAATAPTRYVPVNAPGETVNGVPVRGGPQKLRPGAWCASCPWHRSCPGR
ncbi:hypothetical protein SNARM312S_05795 [Streptomyces narbonensis]